MIIFPEASDPRRRCSKRTVFNEHNKSVNPLRDIVVCLIYNESTDALVDMTSFVIIDLL